MTKLRVAALAALGLLTWDRASFAQPGEPEGEGAAPPAEGTEVELEEDPPPEDMEGIAENPDAPRLPGDEPTPADPAAPPPAVTGYPIEEVLRPITLPAVTSEVALDVGSRFDPIDLEIGVRARYGITRQWQIGLRYLIGGLYDDEPGVGDDAAKFNTGKAFGLDVTYLVFDWLGARVNLPFYVDPFAMGVGLGAPMKFRIGDQLAIVAFDEIIDFKIVGFVPSLRSEFVNETLATAYDVTNTTTPRGNLYLKAGVIYQQSQELAIRGNFQQTFDDFGDDDNPTGIEVIGQYSTSPDMDVALRLGIDALDQASSTFGVLLLAAYRI